MVTVLLKSIPDMETTTANQMRKKVSVDSTLLIRNDILKLLYAGMLLEMPQFRVREFWKRHPLPDAGDAKDEKLLFNTIWQEKKSLPIDYLVDVFNDVEPFLVTHGVDATTFITKTFQRINNGMLISAKSILRLGKPFLSYFYLEKDPRPLILSIIEYFTDMLAPGIVHKLLRQESNGVWHSATILVMYSRAIEQLRLHKKVYVKEFPPYDCELWTGMLVQSIPYCLNMPPFEELHMIGDCRTIEQIVADKNIAITKDKLYINDEHYGNVVSFSSFCEDKKYKLHKYKIPSSKVILVTRDYCCPERKRVVLHANCAYKTPVYLYNFRYRKGAVKPEDFMANIIDEATGDTSNGWAEAQKAHGSLLEKLSFKADIIYYCEEESISINGKHITKFAPAKIMRKMLINHLKTGQKIFEHREFLRDESIIYDPLNPNLNIRLQRLTKVLQENCPKIGVSKAGRGKIRLSIDCRYSYTEQ